MDLPGSVPSNPPYTCPHVTTSHCASVSRFAASVFGERTYQIPKDSVLTCDCVWSEALVHSECACVCVCLCVCIFHRNENFENYILFSLSRPATEINGSTCVSVRWHCRYWIETNSFRQMCCRTKWRACTALLNVASPRSWMCCLRQRRQPSHNCARYVHPRKCISISPMLSLESWRRTVGACGRTIVYY